MIDVIKSFADKWTEAFWITGKTNKVAAKSSRDCFTEIANVGCGCGA